MALPSRGGMVAADRARGAGMDVAMAGLEPAAFWAAMAVTLFAGFVKGAVGFAMPLIMISAFNGFLPPELAVAGLILPTLITNLSQSTRQGMPAAWESVIAYRRFLIGTVVFIILSAPLLTVIPLLVPSSMFSVPVVMVSSSVSEKRSGPPVESPVVVRSMATPTV